MVSACPSSAAGALGSTAADVPGYGSFAALLGAACLFAACGKASRGAPPPPAPAAKLVIDGNVWKYGGVELRFLDRTEQWEAVLGPPSRRDEAEGGEALTWDALGIMIAGARSPDGRGYVQQVHLDLGDAAAASPARRAGHESPRGKLWAREGLREPWSWNGALLGPGDLLVADAVERMQPKPFVHRSSRLNMSRLELSAWEPDAFVVDAYADLFCEEPAPPGDGQRPACAERIDEIDFEVGFPLK